MAKARLKQPFNLEPRYRLMALEDDIHFSRSILIQLQRIPVLHPAKIVGASSRREQKQPFASRVSISLHEHQSNSAVKIDHDQVCQEISGELQDMARWLAGGGLSPEQFRLGLTRIEDRKLRRFGLKLSSLVSEDGVVHFSLRFADTEELCASMDVDPITGQLVIQPACRASPEIHP